MPIRVRVEIDGVSTVISNIEEWGAGLESRIEEAVGKLSEDSEKMWKGATPRREGTLQEADIAKPSGMSFTLENPVHYYDWVDQGHIVLKGWKIKTGVAGRLSGRYMTKSVTGFVEINLLERLGKAVSGE